MLVKYITTKIHNYFTYHLLKLYFNKSDFNMKKVTFYKQFALTPIIEIYIELFC